MDFRGENVVIPCLELYNWAAEDNSSAIELLMSSSRAVPGFCRLRSDFACIDLRMGSVYLKEQRKGVRKMRTAVKPPAISLKLNLHSIWRAAETHRHR